MFYGKFERITRQQFRETLLSWREVFGRVYANDNLVALSRNTGFDREPRFQESFRRHAHTGQEKSLGWRLHTLTWAADHCLDVPGDFVECGVYKGFSMAVVADYVRFEKTSKTLYLYDTFEGIPDEFNSEKRPNTVYEQANAKSKDALYQEVLAKFAPYSNVRVVRGA